MNFLISPNKTFAFKFQFVSTGWKWGQAIQNYVITHSGKIYK